MLFAPLRLIRRLLSLVVLAGLVWVIFNGVKAVNASHLSSDPSAVARARAIVVLGEPSGANQVDSDLLSRLEQALSLYRAGRARKVVVFSGSTSRSAAADWLIASGVRRRAVTEVVGSGTVSELANTTTLLGHGAHVIVVIDAIEALWAQSIAQSDGLIVSISPAEGSTRSIFTEIGPLAKVASGVAVGRVIGYGHVSWVPS